MAVLQGCKKYKTINFEVLHDELRGRGPGLGAPLLAPDLVGVHKDYKKEMEPSAAAAPADGAPFSSRERKLTVGVFRAPPTPPLPVSSLRRISFNHALCPSRSSLLLDTDLPYTSCDPLPEDVTSLPSFPDTYVDTYHGHEYIRPSTPSPEDLPLHYRHRMLSLAFAASSIDAQLELKRSSAYTSSFSTPSRAPRIRGSLMPVLQSLPQVHSVHASWGRTCKGLGPQKGRIEEERRRSWCGGIAGAGAASASSAPLSSFDKAKKGGSASGNRVRSLEYSSVPPPTRPRLAVPSITTRTKTMS
ncbi:hypothetical protein R3P38DRAFT_3259555 [Favolaschia claudopus]|uniref:Uncharacterized protein n=1 Tax=Favolaschia claudopus TaxID=2862362 RepID=A0AAW0CYB8_9AGAR